MLQTRASAQCVDQWLFGPDQGDPGISGDVYATLEWTMNGPGGPHQVLVAAGSFNSAGNVFANSLAYWDGEWHPFGSGIQGYHSFSIRALCDYKGELIAAGNFDHIDGVAANSIARWNGSTWQPLGLGIVGTVSALYAIGDTLYAGGVFSSAGGVTTNNVAAWDGVAWNALGGGVSSYLDGVVTFAQFQGQLRAGGFFTIPGSTGSGFATWNGSTWQGDSLSHSSRALCVYNGFLYSGEAGVVRRWNGTTWTNVTNGGMSGPGTVGVTSLIEHNGVLFAAGPFTSAAGASANSVATWDGVKWNAVGTGIRNPQNGSTFAIRTIAKFGASVIVGGTFTSDAPVSCSIAQWNGTNWKSVGNGPSLPAPPGFIYADQTPLVASFGQWNGDLVLGGTLTAPGANPAANIALNHGGAWTPLGAGLSHTSDVPYVTTIASFRGQLIAGGTFNRSGQTTVNNIAAWNGVQWSALGLGVNAQVQDVKTFNGDLIAAGHFTSADGATALRIARWDGAAWYPLGSGADNAIFALALYQGELIAGGRFSSVDAIAAAHIARWDGNRWAPLGVGIDDPAGVVLALTVHNGDLIVGGAFNSAGGTVAHGVASWNGSSWTSLGLDSTNGVYSLASKKGGLYAVGKFSLAGGPASYGLAKWNGASWQSAGNFDTFGQTLFSWGDELFVGGHFSRVEGQVSIAWARYGGCSFCPADLDGDSSVTDADFAIFITAYDILDCADPAMRADCNADFTHDGFVDDADFLTFVAAYDVMICP
ncbi:MAG: hypothetical protein KF805_07855 [Phycisphaeraceae bacterium]|nr:hypothetical protein [Phycisphaeraceae bacterium]